ncbi:hypothetical protein [Silvanigrella sp.]|jgi:hypothetical protein|uniref:hypothetical protein n=1 Tax=Silvanigrella sp. TaxID=2024976 RepID=UPI0037CA4A4F
MKKTFVYLLRGIIILSLFIPIVIPFIYVKDSDENNSYLNILIPQDTQFKIEDKINIENIINKNFGSNITINYQNYGLNESIPSQDYDDLLGHLSKAKGVSVILSKSAFFGEDAKIFTNKLKETILYKENKIYFLPIQQVLKDKKNEEDYLALSDIFIPKISFLGEESIASVNIIGKVKSHSEIQAEIVIHSGDSFLNSKTFHFKVPKNGLVNTTVDIPINFTKTGNQVISADITSSLTNPPLNSASTTVQVVYSKTTLLHISVGPDWSLRTLRQKLKFWPNLDLLSYYILRETNSDQSIPNSQLSLIEFPADKLFGVSLQNFHGIIAQNFLFDTYLGERESENLIHYVKNGGRLVIQGGPLSFLSENSSIKSIFPCENKPKWDYENLYHWTANDTNFISNHNFYSSLSNIVTHYTAINCKPKKEAIILAKTKEGDHPILLAMPAEKGIVLSFLAGDWLYGYTQEKIQNTAEVALRMKDSDSSEYVFNWMVEFLQRRQDSGIRAPDIAGPRIYADDSTLRVKSRGGIQIDKSVTLATDSKKFLKANTFILNHLDKEMIKLQNPMNSIINIQNKNKINSTSVSLALGLEDKDSEILKFGTWPIFPSNAKSQENKENPFLFEGIPELSEINADLPKDVYVVSKKVPLIVAYPWILAFALLLLGIEQFLARILWRKYF